jgi:hypothetical protein
MLVSEDFIQRLKDSGRGDLAKIYEAAGDGYGGMDSYGRIVDRRICQGANPIPKNDWLGIPKPKTVEQEKK